MTENEVLEILKPEITRAFEAGRVAERQSFGGIPQPLRYSKFTSAVPSDHPAELKPHQFISSSEWDKALKNNYLDAKGNKIESSRQTPAETPDVPLGVWKLDDFAGPHGRKITQLREFDPRQLEKAEPGLVESNFQNRGEDAGRYRQWIEQGSFPPPIDVVQTVDNHFKVSDGHRRRMAAEKAGIPIRAWVSPLIATGDFDAEGNPIYTALTLELASKYGQPEPSRNDIPTVNPSQYAKYADDVQPAEETPRQFVPEDYPEHRQLLSTIHQNPLDATGHLVHADWLDENGFSDEAAFRRAMGEWHQTNQVMNLPVYHKHLEPIGFPWADGGYVPQGVNPNDLSIWDEREGDIDEGARPTDPTHALQVWKSRYWQTYPHMENAFRNAFHTNLKRQREQPPEPTGYARKSIGKYWREQDVTRQKGRFMTPARRGRMSWTRDVQTEEGTPIEYAEEYDFREHPEYKQLLASVHENPTDATGHLVLADWLAEQNQPDEEAFRRSMGKWMQGATPYNPHDESDWDWAIPSLQAVPSGVDRYRLPMGREGYDEDYGDVRFRPIQPTWNPGNPTERESIPREHYGNPGPFLNPIPNHGVRWSEYPHMEAAFRWAFDPDLFRREQLPEPTQSARYSGIPWQTPPIEYDAEHAPAGGVEVAGRRFKGGEFIPAEVMTKATPEERQAVESGEARGKPLPPQRKKNLPKSDSIEQQADAKSRTILTRLKGIPRAAVEKAKVTIQDKYTKLVARYGPAYAKMIVGAGIASLPVPVPGAAIAFAAPLLALAEMHRAISGGVALGGNYMRYADDVQSDTFYDPNAERERQRAGFEQAIDENPLEATNHGVYADWLDENGEPDEAEFRRALGEWYRDGYQHDNYRPKGEWSWQGGYDPNQRKHLTWPKGVDFDLIPRGYPEHATTWGTPHRLRWHSRERMEEGLRQAFHENLRRQREQSA